MKRNYWMVLVFVLCFGAFNLSQAFAECVPAKLAQNPSPIKSVAAPGAIKNATGSDCLSSEKTRYANGEEKVIPLELKKGNYWISVTGCPRVDELTFSVATVGNSNKVIKKGKSLAPSGCFSVPADGVYTLKIKADTGYNTWGNVNYCVSRSGCK